ncbi:MAG: N-acetyl-gamma-glutamyl-phosphate reductase [archaeon]
MIAAGVVGGTGAAGSHLIGLLLGHPEMDIRIVTSRSEAGTWIGKIHPGLASKAPKDLEFSDPDFEALNKLDVVFLAVPHGTAKDIAAKLTCKVIDIADDHRLDEVYGLPELSKEKIAEAKLVANPGCYATACILAALPLKDRIQDVVFNCISGYSGGGKNPPYDYKDNIIAYKLADHRHRNEMTRVLGVPFSFIPHVTDVHRGLMCTAVITLKEGETIDIEAIKKLYTKTYAGTFTKVVDEIPTTKDVVGTPYCKIGGFVEDGRKLIIISVIDNLLKGAASQAIENANIMFNLPRDSGLNTMKNDNTGGN